MPLEYFKKKKKSFYSICAYDVSCVEKGPVFRIPVTVFQPEPINLSEPGYPTISRQQVLFKPSEIRRHFVIPPPDTTWGVLRITTDDKSKSGKFIVHNMQILPEQSCKSHEHMRLINLTAHAPMALPFGIVVSAGIFFSRPNILYRMYIRSFTFRPLGCVHRLKIVFK